MAGEKRFGTSLLGFKKADVNSYIERILREFDNKLKDKDDEIISLKNQYREIKARYDNIAKNADQINEDRTKIAQVLIKAQEKAELMIEDARAQALDEKKSLEQLIEQEKERLVDIKEEIKGLKAEVVNTLKKYEFQLDDIVEEKASGE